MRPCMRVCLVNSRHVRHVPGRKSDVSDCQWLQYLHSVGLLKPSFRPDAAIENIHHCRSGPPSRTPVVAVLEETRQTQTSRVA
jgi:hypothetical protein